MYQETIHLLETRRSTRAFKREPLEKELVDELKRLTMRAPSAGNMLLYSVVEVQDKEKKLALSEICDHQKMIAEAPLVWVFLADNQKWENYYKGSKSEEKFQTKMRPSGLGDMHLCMQDAIIAAQNCVIAAEALGLGSCYIGDIIENYEKLRDLLALPAHACPACLLILGKPLSEERKTVTPRPDVDGGVFMVDSYHTASFEELEKQYQHHTEYNRAHKRLPLDGKGTTADEYFSRKYMSDFMDEMNRSAKVFMDRWAEEQ